MRISGSFTALTSEFVTDSFDQIFDHSSSALIQSALSAVSGASITVHYCDIIDNNALHALANLPTELATTSLVSALVIWLATITYCVSLTNHDG